MSAERPGPRQPDVRPRNWEHLKKVFDTLTPARKDIVRTLVTRPWYQQTAPELQVRLATLPMAGKENHDGFLKDMAERPNEVGGVKVERLSDLAAGNFALIPKFDVTNQGGDTFTYEYVSWRYGPDSGAKGLVFVKGKDDEFSHFILLRGDKFSTGKKEFDTVGGFADLNTGHPADKQVETMLDRIKTEVKEELGAPDIRVSNVYDLGKLHPDAGMTNNHPDLFAAVIDGSEATKVAKGTDTNNPDKLELRSGAIVLPMSQLAEVIRNNNDGLFLAAVARSLAHGVIKWENVDQTPVPYKTKRAA